MVEPADGCGLASATIHNGGKRCRVVCVRRPIIMGDERSVVEVLEATGCSRRIDTDRAVDVAHETIRARSRPLGYPGVPEAKTGFSDGFQAAGPEGAEAR